LETQWLVSIIFKRFMFQTDRHSFDVDETLSICQRKLKQEQKSSAIDCLSLELSEFLLKHGCKHTTLH